MRFELLRGASSVALMLMAAACGAPPRASTGPAGGSVEGDKDGGKRYGGDEALVSSETRLAVGDAGDGHYLAAIEARLDPPWVSFLQDCQVRLPPTDALNVSSLSAQVQLSLSRDGTVAAVTIRKSSGNLDFDKVALDIAGDLGPLPSPPEGRRSDDGTTYLLWSFFRDHRAAGAASASWFTAAVPLVTAVPKLLADLRFARAAERIAESEVGATVQSQMMRQVAEAIVTEGLKHLDPPSQRVALRALRAARFSAQTTVVRQLARSGDSGVALAAIRALGVIGDESDRELLRSVVWGSTTSPEVATAAASALQGLGFGAELGREATRRLSGERRAENEKKARVASALGILGVVESPQSVPLLAKLLTVKSDVSRAERIAAAAALGRQASADKLALKALLRASASGSASIRVAALEAIAGAAQRGMTSRGAYWKSLEMAKDRDERVRASAIAAAAALDGKRFAKELGGLRPGTSVVVARRLLGALATIPGKAALDRLLAAVTSPQDSLRLAAAKSLAKRKEPEASRALEQLLVSGPDPLRLAALGGGCFSSEEHQVAPDGSVLSGGCEPNRAKNTALSEESLVALSGSSSSPDVQIAAFAVLTRRRGQAEMAAMLAQMLSRPSLDLVSRLLWVKAWLDATPAE